MSAETLRWGDSQTLAWVGGGGANPAPILVASKQLLQAAWHWPAAWAVLLVMIPQLAAGESATFSVTWQVTVGVGQATMTYPLTYTFASPYTSQSAQLVIPAENIQASATVSGTPAAAGAASFVVAAFAAPITTDRGGVS
jgi:hypothetical protein